MLHIKNVRERLQRPFLRNSLIQILFITVTSLAVFIATRYGYWISNGDGPFHYQRLIEISHALSHGQLPAFNLHTATLRGLATNTFYPWEVAAPIAIIFGWMHYHIMALYGVIGIEILATLESTYYSAWTWHHDLRYDLLISCGYGISVTTYVYAIAQQDFAMVMAMAFIPLVYYGFLHWMNDGHWRMLTWGMIGLIFTHLPTAVLAVIIFGIWTTCCYRKLDRTKITDLGKAIGITALATMIQWLPMLILRNSVANWVDDLTPLKLGRGDAGSFYLMLFYMSSVATILGLASVIRWKRMPRMERHSYLFGLALIVIMLPLVPRPILLKIATSPLGMLQLGFVNRLVMFSQLFLADVAGGFILNRYGWTFHREMPYLIGILALVIGIGCFGFTSRQTSPTWLPKIRYRSTYTISKQCIGKGISRYDSLKELIKHEQTPIYNDDNGYVYCYMSNVADYSPIKSASERTALSERYALTGHDKKLSVNVHPDTVTFQLRRPADELELPIAIYDHQKYHICVNGKPAGYRNNNHAVTLRNVRPGRYQVSVKAPTMWYRWIALLVSSVTTIIFAGRTVIKNRKH